MFHIIYLTTQKEENKMKRIYKYFGLVALFFVAMVGLIGCKPSDSGSQTPNSTEITPTEKTSITISFDSRYGNLPFKTIQKEKNSENIVYLDDYEFPKVSNEGDERIFDKWVYDSGVEFCSDISISSDITLHATFVESEFIWVSEWKQYEDSLQYYGTMTTEVQGILGNNLTVTTTTNLSAVNKTAQFKKIKKSDCLDEYVTKAEYNQIRNKFCFITSSSGQEKIVTESDVTGDVYEYNAVIVFAEWCVGYNSVGYMPKGHSLYENKKLSISSISDSYLLHFLSENTLEDIKYSKCRFDIDTQSSKHFVIKNNEDYKKVSSSLLREKCNDGSYECNYAFDEDYYYALVVSDYVYSITSGYSAEKTVVERYDYMAKNWVDGESAYGGARVRLNCSKEEFNEFAQQYHIAQA